MSYDFVYLTIIGILPVQWLKMSDYDSYKLPVHLKWKIIRVKNGENSQNSSRKCRTQIVHSSVREHNFPCYTILYTQFTIISVFSIYSIRAHTHTHTQHTIFKRIPLRVSSARSAVSGRVCLYSSGPVRARCASLSIPHSRLLRHSEPSQLLALGGNWNRIITYH